MKNHTDSQVETFWAMIDADDAKFYQTFDPFYFWTMAECIHSAEPADVQLMDPTTGDVVKEHPLLERLQKSRKNYTDYSSYTVRALRYFSSETLILLLFAQPKKNPFARAASVMRNEALFRPIREISEGSVPAGYEARSSGRVLSFDEWVSYMAFGSHSHLTDAQALDVVELIREEAELLSERGAINAYKHGKPTSFGNGASLQVKGDYDEYLPLNSVLSGINWVDWHEKAGKSLSLAFCTEVLDPVGDKKRLFSVALLMDAICQIRESAYAGSNRASFQIPTDFKLGEKVQRQKIKLEIKNNGATK